MNKLKLAACGVDCGDCAQYKVTMEQDMKAAEALAPWFKSQGWIGEDENAEAVMKKAPLCRGCWDKTAVFWGLSGSCGQCILRACCEEKQINHCGECGSFPCSAYMDWVADLDHHKKALEYLLSLNKL
jgi:hypothetical protein